MSTSETQPDPPSQPKVPATPELDRQAEIIHSGRSGTVQEFYDWLTQEKGYVLARYVSPEERYADDGIYGEQPVPVLVRPEDLMADFFGIDLNKIETERRALLDALRAMNS
jgi:hypothetical protein